MKQYAKAKAFYEEYGHLSVSAKYTKEHGGTLSQWLNNQRQQYIQENHGKLTDEQVKLLDEIHLELRTKNEVLWSKKYALMKKYVVEHGDFLVPSEYITSDGTKLGRWACRMRAEYAKGLLPKHQVDLLNEIGMNWDNIETVRAEQFWEEMYLVAQKYFECHGNLKVSAQHVTEDGVKLGQWLAQQRRIRRGTLKHSIELNEDRIGRLDALGMVWEHKVISWDECYMALLEYVAEYGDARVLSGYKTADGINLGNWVQNQRCEYRKGKLRADRIEKLNQINFIWNIEDDRWRQNYGAIKKYYEENGNCYIPTSMKNEYGESIYNWLAKVRRYYHSGEIKFSDEQIKMLKDINVVKEGD